VQVERGGVSINAGLPQTQCDGLIGGIHQKGLSTWICTGTVTKCRHRRALGRKENSRSFREIMHTGFPCCPCCRRCRPQLGARAHKINLPAILLLFELSPGKELRMEKIDNRLACWHATSAAVQQRRRCSCSTTRAVELQARAAKDKRETMAFRSTRLSANGKAQGRALAAAEGLVEVAVQEGTAHKAEGRRLWWRCGP